MQLVSVLVSVYMELNRLGGNSLLETVVFGRLVADKIINNIQDLHKSDIQILESEVINTESQN